MDHSRRSLATHILFACQFFMLSLYHVYLVCYLDLPYLLTQALDVILSCRTPHSTKLITLSILCYPLSHQPRGLDGIGGDGWPIQSESLLQCF